MLKGEAILDNLIGLLDFFIGCDASPHQSKVVDEEPANGKDKDEGKDSDDQVEHEIANQGIIPEGDDASEIEADGQAGQDE